MHMHMTCCLMFNGNLNKLHTYSKFIEMYTRDEIIDRDQVLSKFAVVLGKWGGG